ncbi:MAG TPA: MmgE/PrpD family protein [Vicinamibacterales bacterium]|nr:MmgE/PrpD family protein [Vicinamibacterales bacterium]
MSQSVAASEPLASKVAAWVAALGFDDLPADVVATTKLRVLDVIGLSLAGSATALGHSVRAGVHAMAPQGPSRVWGSGDRTAAPFAAFANASFAQALEFDDTHNESIVHMSSPSVAAALALAETRHISGRDLLVAVAVGNEIACRIGSVAPGTFHRRGFHPTGLFSPFGIAYAAGKLLGLDAPAMAWAAGISGSTAAGLLECWVDGTQSKFMHSGFAAQNGMAAAMLAQAGASGPPKIFEGRFGLFASHLQDPAVVKNFSRITDRLGTRWDSRNSSFKPFPAAHVLHPYIDLVLRLRAQHGIRPADVVSIECPVAEFNVSIVCEPVAEKTAPATEAHCRVCLQYTLAEALVRGELGRLAYGEANRTDPVILALAKRVTYRVDPHFPPPGRFKGALTMTLADGRVFTEVEEYNRGSAENPMTAEELRAKFDDNASSVLDAGARDLLARGVAGLEAIDDAGSLVRLACRV